MSKLTDYAKQILVGGLPTLLDGIAGSQGDNRAETTAPTGSRLQRDAAKNEAPVYDINLKTIGIAVAGLAAVGLTLALVIRAAR